MSPLFSILISSYNRLPLLRRTLFSIARKPPPDHYEVVVCDDGSNEDVLGELRGYSSQFPWKFVRFDATAFEQETGLKKFLNNPCVTNNIAFQHSEGEFVFQQGNEILVWKDCYARMIADAPAAERWLVFSTTYDVPQQYLDVLDSYGSNISQGLVDACAPWPLQSEQYRSDVTNYVSLAPRLLWEELGGYDERYYGGISAEDSDFVRRARALGTRTLISQGVSLHQFHSGKTRYYDPPRKLITPERWTEGVAINHSVYHGWNGQAANGQKWPWGKLGVKEVICS